MVSGRVGTHSVLSKYDSWPRLSVPLDSNRLLRVLRDFIFVHFVAAGLEYWRNIYIAGAGFSLRKFVTEDTY